MSVDSGHSLGTGLCLWTVGTALQLGFWIVSAALESGFCLWTVRHMHLNMLSGSNFKIMFHGFALKLRELDAYHALGRSNFLSV